MKNSQGYGKLQGAALFFYICRGEIHQKFLVGKRIAGVGHRYLYAVKRFADGFIRQTDNNGHVIIAIGQVDFHLATKGVNTLKYKTVNPGKHKNPCVAKGVLNIEYKYVKARIGLCQGDVGILSGQTSLNPSGWVWMFQITWCKRRSFCHWNQLVMAQFGLIGHIFPRHNSPYQLIHRLDHTSDGPRCGRVIFRSDRQFDAEVL